MGGYPISRVLTEESPHTAASVAAYAAALEDLYGPYVHVEHVFNFVGRDNGEDHAMAVATAWYPDSAGYPELVASASGYAVERDFWLTEYVAQGRALRALEKQLKERPIPYRPA